ncbi:sigma factor-like helix-turn-helix DNA-binding protein [Streptomyces sp. NPDC060064]|uniref:sigma factor-like helix-turn-helix DNA-binding protein n=1 Tax=Streptomyces sp. NPDC060064 TaxID=3347049 RepID=UPI00367BD11E
MTQRAPRSTAAAPLPSPEERRMLREAKSLTEEQLAVAVGVRRATIRSWEAGRTSPQGSRREAYAKLLAAPGTEPAELSVTTAPSPWTEPAPQAPDPDPAPDPDRTDRTNALTSAPAVREAPRQDPPPPPRAELTPAEAFDALYSYVAPALVRQTYLLTGRRRLSHESVERAFHLAWQHWPEVAHDGDPAGWVRAVAYEYAMSPWHRLLRAHNEPDSRPPAEPGRRALLDALLELPPPYRRTVLLYDGLGLGLPETAAETEASTPAAASRVLHARAAIAERLPELSQGAALHELLTDLAREGPAPEMTPAVAVRSGSERRTRFWTRVAIAVTTLIVSATAFTVVTAPTRYEPPLAPAQQVDGGPVLSGPQLPQRDTALRKQLRSLLANGPERLVPQIR